MIFTQFFLFFIKYWAFLNYHFKSISLALHPIRKVPKFNFLAIKSLIIEQ
jgi:hypothetical protein